MSKIKVKIGKRELKLAKSKKLVGLKRNPQFNEPDKNFQNSSFVKTSIYDSLGGFNVVSLDKEGESLDKKLDEVRVKKEVAVEEKIVVEKVNEVDDLKVIKGIGPVLEKSLNELNITAYSQIAKMTIKNMTKLLTDSGINAKIYDLSGWKAQAKLALKGDMEAVKNWSRK